MQHKKWAFIISGIVVLCCVSACGSFTDNEEKEISSNKWLDEKDYKNRLLENRVPISEYREDYKLETERIRNADYENLSFSSAEFADFPDGEEVSLLKEEELVVAPQESWDLIGQWLEETGKSDQVDMEKEVRIHTSEAGWQEDREYPYNYPALAEHMDLKDGRGAFISTRDCHYMVYYDMADGKMTEYLGKDELAIYEVEKVYTGDIEASGTLEEIGAQSYPLISGELTIQEGADLLTDYFDHGTVTTPADGVTLGVEKVNVFHLGDVYGYEYLTHRIYKGIPVSCQVYGGFQLVGCPYLPAEDSKYVYIVDDTGVSAYRGNSECMPLTELYTDSRIMGVEDAAQLLSEKLASGLRMDVEKLSMVYAPYDAETDNSDRMLLPSWKFEGTNHTKGEKLVAYVDVLTGDLYYYTIPERHQVK